jgi:hypothetical protein
MKLTGASLLLRSRRSDLIVLGRRAPDGPAQGSVIELLLLGSGHPVPVAPEAPSARDFETIVVGWQETAAASRSLGAAMPLLQRARKVYLVTMVESLDASGGAIDLVEDQLCWHGICADTRSVVCPRRHVSEELLHIVAELNAGVTQSAASIVMRRSSETLTDPPHPYPAPATGHRYRPRGARGSRVPTTHDGRLA